MPSQSVAPIRMIWPGAGNEYAPLAHASAGQSMNRVWTTDDGSAL